MLRNDFIDILRFVSNINFSLIILMIYDSMTNRIPTDAMLILVSIPAPLDALY